MATVDNIKLARYLRIVHFKFMILKKLYDRCVELARHKFSKPLLGFVAFIESFFFPVPPDLMIVPMVVAKREDYLKIFIIATTGSVLGGLFGYMLGVFFLDVSMASLNFTAMKKKFLRCKIRCLQKVVF